MGSLSENFLLWTPLDFLQGVTETGGRGEGRGGGGGGESTGGEGSGGGEGR